MTTQPQCSEAERSIKRDWTRLWYESLDSWGVVSSAYKKAADLICEQCSDDPETSNDLIFPTLFLYRHYVELSIKELIACCHDLNYVASKVETIHFLPKLYTSLQSLLPRYVSDSEIAMPDGTVRKVSDALAKLKEAASEWDVVDKKSFRFRYPKDTENNPNPYPTLPEIFGVKRPINLRAKMNDLGQAINSIALAILAKSDHDASE